MQAHGVSLRVFYGRMDTKMLTMKPNRSENNKNNEKRKNNRKNRKLIVNFSSQPASHVWFGWKVGWRALAHFGIADCHILLSSSREKKTLNCLPHYCKFANARRSARTINAIYGVRDRFIFCKRAAQRAKRPKVCIVFVVFGSEIHVEAKCMPCIHHFDCGPIHRHRKQSAHGTVHAIF